MTTTLNPGQITFIAAKNQPPLPPPALLCRDKFNEILHDLEPVSLLLVHAPAGYGKTTTIAERLATLEARTAWVRLESSDNDPGRFAGYLANALNGETGGSCAQVLKALQSDDYPDLEAFLTDLLADLPQDDEPLYLVLDDYHLITNVEIHEALRFLLRHLPGYLTLVVISRTIPPVGVAELRMQGRLAEVTSRDLGFGPDEAQQYLQSRLPFEIAREDIERAVRRVEGWISALQLLSASAATSIEFSDFVDQLEHGNQNIFDYFDELVGNDLSEQQRRFLMRTSILER
ncbi:MAG: HTH-type transcriptional regulator MalT, partial [Marinobacter sp.]|nr:HTH-type transcriptional regulator MalT [Marinobacter sp.]